MTPFTLTPIPCLRATTTSKKFRPFPELPRNPSMSFSSRVGGLAGRFSYCLSGKARGPGSLGGPGSWYSHGQTAHSSREPRAGTPSRAGTPCPLPSQRGAEGGERSRPEGGVPARGGGRGPGSWHSSAYTVSSSVGIPRAGSPQRAGTPRIFPHELFQSGRGAGWKILSLFDLLSGSAKRERLKGRNGSLSKIFADFCRFGPRSAK